MKQWTGRGHCFTFQNHLRLTPGETDMNAPESGSRGGWNFWKILGLIIGCVGMGGFGACGLWGLAVGLSAGASGGDGWSQLFVFCGIAGVVLAALFFLLIRAVLRRVGRKALDTP
jgi:hypothetical protein